MSTTPKSFETISSSDRASFRAPLALVLLSLALGYAIFEDGGTLLTPWNICLLLIGLSTFIYWWPRKLPAAVTADAGPAPVVLLLFLSYIAFQCLPLPVALLGILSPERARILDSLARVGAPVRFAPLAITPATTFIYLFRFIGYSAAFLAIRDVTRRWSARRRWLAVIPLAGFAVLEAALGLWQNSAGEEVNGTYVNRNHFAGLLEMALPLAVAYGIAILNRKYSRTAPAMRIAQAFAILACAGAIFAGLLSSLSKMGFVAGLGGLFAIAALATAGRLRGWKLGFAIAGIAALVLFLFLFLPSDELVARFGGVAAQGDAAAEGRWPIWRDSLHLVAAYPVFGSGLGTYAVAFLKYQTSIVDRLFDYAHNDYLQLTAELGAAGFLLLAALVLPVGVNAFRAATRSRDPDTRWLALGCAGAFTAIGLHSLLDFNTYIPANALMLAWIGGISAGVPAGPTPASAQPARVFAQRRIALWLAALLIVYSPAWVLFRTVFRGDPRAEGVFCHFGICDTDAVIVAETLGHAGNAAAVPEADLLKALRRDPNSPDRWCDAGDGFVRAGQWSQALYCLSRVLALGPNIPPVLLRASDSYFRLHQIGRALELRARVLQETDTYDDLIFNWYRTEQLPTNAVLANGLPEDARAGRAYLRILMRVDESRGAAEAWNWNVGHGYADLRLANDYLGFLMNRQQYEAAAQAWARYLGPRRDGYMETDWIFNGDFENEFSGSPFDWRIDPRDDVDVARDAGMAHSGAHSLRIRFAGNENINYSYVSETAFVKPGKYRFEAWVRTDHLTTDEGVGFRVLDPAAPSALDVRTERLTGTNDWKRIERVFDVGPKTQLILIQVVRQPSLKFDNKIAGAVWIDSVKLTRENPQKLAY